jgi:hypothetical protein
MLICNTIISFQQLKIFPCNSTSICFVDVVLWFKIRLYMGTLSKCRFDTFLDHHQ